MTTTTQNTAGYSSKAKARAAAIAEGLEPIDFVTVKRTDGRWSYKIAAISTAHEVNEGESGESTPALSVETVTETPAEVEAPAVESADESEAPTGWGEVDTSVESEVSAPTSSAEVEQASFPVEYHGAMHEEVVFEDAGSLKDALGEAVAELKGGLTDDQKAEMLSKDAALAAVVEAFDALTAEQQGNFRQVATFKKGARKAKARGKAEIDAELVELAKSIFSIETPNKSHFDRIALARAGELPVMADMAAPAYRHTVKKYGAMMEAAIEAKNVEALEEMRDEIQPYCTSQKVFRAHAALSAIAISAQLDA